jgi:hypothetical protein
MYLGFWVASSINITYMVKMGICNLLYFLFVFEVIVDEELWHTELFGK